jgi:hypothetical protein
MTPYDEPVCALTKSRCQAAGVLAEALERPVEYVQVDFETARAGMPQAGLPEAGADMYVEMFQALNDGRMGAAEPRDPKTDPTTVRHRPAAAAIHGGDAGVLRATMIVA